MNEVSRSTHLTLLEHAKPPPIPRGVQHSFQALNLLFRPFSVLEIAIHSYGKHPIVLGIELDSLDPCNVGQTSLFDGVVKANLEIHDIFLVISVAEVLALHALDEPFFPGDKATNHITSHVR